MQSQYLTKSDKTVKIAVIKSYVQNDLLGFSKQQNVSVTNIINVIKRNRNLVHKRPHKPKCVLSVYNDVTVISN